jgi:hypothetical protein
MKNVFIMAISYWETIAFLGKWTDLQFQEAVGHPDLVVENYRNGSGEFANQSILQESHNTVSHLIFFVTEPFFYWIVLL